MWAAIARIGGAVLTSAKSAATTAVKALPKAGRALKSGASKAIEKGKTIVGKVKEVQQSTVNKVKDRIKDLKESIKNRRTQRRNQQSSSSSNQSDNDPNPSSQRDRNGLSVDPETVDPNRRNSLRDDIRETRDHQTRTQGRILSESVKQRFLLTSIAGFLGGKIASSLDSVSSGIISLNEMAGIDMENQKNELAQRRADRKDKMDAYKDRIKSSFSSPKEFNTNKWAELAIILFAVGGFIVQELKSYFKDFKNKIADTDAGKMLGIEHTADFEGAKFKDKGLGKEKGGRMTDVYKSFRNAGYSDKQAKAMTAEIGRENSFDDKFLFGGHNDPKNGKYNLGMMSWQGARGKELYEILDKKGLIKDGKIVQSQKSLDEMASFSMKEMKSKKFNTEDFLNLKDIDQSTAARILGKNYVKWRYDDPKYANGHARRDNYYSQIESIVNSGDLTPDSTYDERVLQDKKIDKKFATGRYQDDFVGRAIQKTNMHEDVKDILTLTPKGMVQDFYDNSILSGKTPMVDWIEENMINPLKDKALEARKTAAEQGRLEEEKKKKKMQGNKTIHAPKTISQGNNSNNTTVVNNITEYSDNSFQDYISGGKTKLFNV